MKAKEYYEKYKTELVSEDEKVQTEAILKFLNDLLTEIETLTKARHVKYDRGLFPVLKELDKKYRAVVRLFEKEFGFTPIRPDGFEIVLENRIPGVVEKMKGRAESKKLDTHTREGGSDA